MTFLMLLTYGLTVTVAGVVVEWADRHLGGRINASLARLIPEPDLSGPLDGGDEW